MRASATRGAFNVDVSKTGVSISPSSSTCVEPMIFPNALPTNTAPGTFSRKRLPSCGRIAVTPVRTLSPSIRVAWPTRTPATSVMAFSDPTGRMPTFKPMSLARGRVIVSCTSDDCTDRPPCLRSGLCAIWNYVDILQARTGVEENDSIIRRKKAGGEQLSVRYETCRAFGSREYALGGCPLAYGSTDLFVGCGDCRAATFFENVEDDVIGVGLGHPQTCGDGPGVLPEFRDVLVLFPSFHDRSASRRLHGDHPGSLGPDPAQALHFFERLPHADHSHAAAGRI